MNKIKLFRFKFKYLNFRMIFWVLALTLLGIVVIGSAAPGERYEIKQFIGLSLGIVIMMALSMLDYRVILKLHWVEYGICIMLLLAVLVPGIGREVNGARRWIPLVAGFNIQPSEFAKIAMCVWVASFCTFNARTFSLLKHRNGIIPLGVYILFTCGLVALGQDMGTTILIFCTAGAIMLAAGLYLRYRNIKGKQEKIRAR